MEPHKAFRFGSMISDETFARFLEKVTILGKDECWEWSGAKKAAGYGSFRVGRKTRASHRVAYLLSHGSIPEGSLVRHACDNPKCCNPAHLETGTQSDNMRDMSERKRTRGQLLSEVDAAEIRRIYLEDGITQVDIAMRYGVTKSTISSIVRGRNFSRLGCPEESELKAARSRSKASVTGEKCSQSKMTAGVVRAMRTEYASGGTTYKKLAAKYGMSVMAVCNAVRGKSWPDLE